MGKLGMHSLLLAQHRRSQFVPAVSWLPSGVHRAKLPDAGKSCAGRCVQAMERGSMVASIVSLDLVRHISFCLKSEHEVMQRRS